ncbi:MAG: DegT/DnrJ/EryC1/StrS family aminotransferase [Bryobacteraceae bacterium]
MIPLVDLRAALEETAADWRARVERFYQRAHFILGDEVAEFERAFAASTGAREAVGVGTGTSAIELCLRDAGVRGQVLTSPLTAPFTGLAILSAGATPRFADVDPETLLLDPNDAARRAGRRTAALLPVHLYGRPCELDGFVRLARALGVPLVQDACQAHGARFRGKSLTGYSPYVAYSFYPTKNLGCLGDGGAVATSSSAVAARIRRLRDGGRKARHVSVTAGVNSRLDELQACYLNAFLPRLAGWNARRARLAALYDESLPAAVLPVPRGPDSVCHLYVVRAPRREKLCAFLRARGIATGVHYPAPLHLHPTFAGCGARRGDLPHAERAAREIVSLPLGPHLGETDVARVAEAIRGFYC